MNRTHSIAALALAVSTLAGCYDELDYIDHRDLKGTVRIPASLVTLDVVDSEDNLKTISGDPRALGPVYLGVYASIRYDLYDFPHPEIGPVLDASTDGNAYPYGGTTIGRFDWGCYQALKCKLVTGRYADYDEVLDFFSSDLETPILNDEGEEVTAGIELRERCYEINYLTGDAEVRFIGPLDFELKGDEWVAEVEILHTDFRKGVSVWGWVDMPSSTFDFRTCDPENGAQVFYYDENYIVGTNYTDVLNFPGRYIGDGDIVAAEPAIIDDPDKAFDITLGLQINE